MKHLTDVFKSSMTSLYESIFDDDIVTRKADMEEYIKDFLEKNYYKINDNNIEIHKVGDKYIVNINTDFGIKYNCNLKSLTNELFEFGEINGNFICSYSKIESLKGAPKKCEMFKCDECENLISLEGAPENVSYLFTCKSCDKLKSLKGAPREANYFDCSYCPNLTSLEGAPKKCKEFDCSHCDKLKSLEGAPEIIHELFWCNNCSQLKSLEGGPRLVGVIFGCMHCENLITLKGAPKECERFNCSGCEKIKTLEGIPKKCLEFYCEYCKNLTTLKELKYIKYKLNTLKIIGCDKLRNNIEEIEFAKTISNSVKF